ncbi:hypothetical protein DEO72_LG11g892 [Vigna unguiculata]|uniref:Uncharacterized protein n=1 Tax=Vigna unguiculata TaxID=3917 RepID=A0A4D6NMJ5_VIGUN|nr:hypothetical protein DEO72_LG11g892 [Vigna unguiculata]
MGGVLVMVVAMVVVEGFGSGGMRVRRRWCGCGEVVVVGGDGCDVVLVVVMAMVVMWYGWLFLWWWWCGCGGGLVGSWWWWSCGVGGGCYGGVGGGCVVVVVVIMVDVLVVVVAVLVEIAQGQPLVGPNTLSSLLTFHLPPFQKQLIPLLLISPARCSARAHYSYVSKLKIPHFYLQLTILVRGVVVLGLHSLSCCSLLLHLKSGEYCHSRPSELVSPKRE